MPFQFSYIVPVYLLVSVLFTFIAARTWALRPALGTTVWSFTMLGCAIYALGTGLEIAFTMPILKLAMIRLIYFGTASFVFFWSIFAIQYSNRGRWLNPFTISLLAAMPVSAVCLALFAESHQLLYQSYEFIQQDGLIIGHVVEYGIFFWLWLAYSVSMFVSSWILLFTSFIRSQAIFRIQAWLVIAASAAPILVYLAHVFGLKLLDPFDPSIIVMVFSGITMLLALSQYRFMDIVPVAYDLIFKNVRSSIVLLDLKGRIVGMNQAAEKVFGVQEQATIGKPVANVLPYLPLSEFGEFEEIKTEVKMPDSETYYELQVTQLANRHNELVGRLLMLYDITERKQVENKTLELSMERERVELLQRFISHMSHDLRTPLSAMKVTQYLLRKEVAGQHTSRLDALAQQTERLTDMAESMVALLRLEKDELEDLVDLDINALLNDVIAENRTLSEKRGTQIFFSADKSLPLFQGNKDDINSVFSKLLLNAITYTPKGGEINISTLRDESHILIRICDNGIGIPEADLPHIFEHFYRADAARGTQTGGFGLGLTIAKIILERHAGTIAVQSQSGEGSQFTIRLPITMTA